RSRPETEGCAPRPRDSPRRDVLLCYHRRARAVSRRPLLHSPRLPETGGLLAGTPSDDSTDRTAAATAVAAALAVVAPRAIRRPRPAGAPRDFRRRRGR